MTKELSIKNITLAVFLAASCNLAWNFYAEWLEIQTAQLSCEDTFTVTSCGGPPYDVRSRFHIELFLLLAFIGSRLRGLNNTVLSAIGLSGAVISYILWWQYLFRCARNAETTVDRIDHFAYLVGGNLLDLAIAAAIGLLVVMNVCKDARSSFRVRV